MRQARSTVNLTHPILDEEPPDGFEVVSSFVHVGRGYLSFHEAAEAVRSAAMARAR